MKEKIAIISILANVVLAGTKILIGLFSHSSAIMAEGFHSLTDIFSSFIGYFGIRAAQKPVDKKHPYGHYKFEVLSGAIITLILLATGLGIIYEAYQSFLSPEEMNLDYLAFSVMLLSVMINFATSKIKIYYGKKENSLTLLADGSHDKADVLASVTVLLGLFLSRYWIYIDSLLAVLIGLYIIKESFSLGKEAIDSMLDISASDETEDKIKSIIEKQGVEIGFLKTQKKGSVITANLEIKLANNLKLDEATKISEHLREKLMAGVDNLVYLAIQIKSHSVETSFYAPSFGRGIGWQRRAKNKETIAEAQGKGQGGVCFCSQCGYETPHTKKIPCSTQECPHCKLKLERR